MDKHHIHIFKITGISEVDIEDESENNALKRALALAKEGHSLVKFGSSKYQFVAVPSFETIEKLTIEDLKKVTWKYTSNEVVGEYNGQIIYSYLWEVEIEGLEPDLVENCNLSEGWVEYIEIEGTPKRDNKLGILLNNPKRDGDGEVIRNRKYCNFKIRLLGKKGNIIVTLEK